MERGRPGTRAEAADRSGRLQRIAVVVLNWNGRDDTLACLRSLRGVTHRDLQIIVVDNASSDDSVTRIRGEHPEVLLIEAHDNLGFAGGNNLGIRRALEDGADAVLVLNNDTEVAPDLLDRLVEAAAAHPEAGVLSPVIYFLEPPDMVWFGGARFDPRRGRSGRMHGYRRTGVPLPAAPAPIDRATGAAMLVTRAAIERAGLMDDDFFFLYEDVDWSLRIRQAGMSVLLVPQARVWHKVSASQGGRSRNPTTLYYALRNNLEVCERYAPLRGWRAAQRQVTCVATHVLHVRNVDARASALAALHAGWRDHRRGLLGPRDRPRPSGTRA